MALRLPGRLPRGARAASAPPPETNAARPQGAPVPTRKDERTSSFVECDRARIPGLTDTADSDLADVLEGVAIGTPRIHFTPTSFAPPIRYWHLDVPGGVSLACNADQAHRAGVTSRIFTGRTVPDLCGLVGLGNHATYLMLPTEPGSDFDITKGGGSYPDGDETKDDDGWVVTSGTSAAAPQLAGACALLLQADPHLTPAQVRQVLRSTARDITTGRCAASTGGWEAVKGPDPATGTGLVDVHAAVAAAHSV